MAACLRDRSKSWESGRMSRLAFPNLTERAPLHHKCVTRFEYDVPLVPPRRTARQLFGQRRLAFLASANEQTIFVDIPAFVLSPMTSATVLPASFTSRT